MENYAEAWHLPSVHPALCDVSGVDEHEMRQGDGMYALFATDPLTKGGTALDADRIVPHPALSAKNSNTAWHVAIFPNVFFSIYPGQLFRVILNANPDEPGRTYERAKVLTHPAALAAPDAESRFQEIFVSRRRKLGRTQARATGRGEGGGGGGGGLDD